jgi:Reverse transcriptase (RNA-dependent DNA polymerase)
LYSYYSTLDDEGDEIDWDQLSDEEFESTMEKLKVKERERISHRDIALGRYKDLAFRACDKSKSYCRPLVKYPPVDVFRAERGGMSTQTVYLFYQKKKRVFLLSYDEAKNDPSSLQAMGDEIATFKRFDCYEEVSSDMVSANANIISTRCVISKKMNVDGTWPSKARLVARGYEEKEKDRVWSDSPVASSAAQRLVLSLLAEEQWIPNSWDFTSAFLQGKSLTRDVFVVPQIDFVGSHVVWSVKKPIYGIESAPKFWFDRLIEVCLASGLTTAITDEELLIMTSGEQVVGVLALHVDDAIGGGTEEFQGVMAYIGKTLAVGSRETSNFRYKGLRMSTVFKDEQTVFEINVDSDDYLDSCRTMDVPLGEDTDLLPPQSMTDYRSVVGTIGYASSEFRPDLAWETSSLSRQFVTPTILDAKRANAALQYPKAESSSSIYEVSRT